MKEYYIESKLGKINVLEGDDIENMKGIVLYVHGIGSHFQFIYDCNDYIYYREKFFGKFGIKTFGFEFNSHGKSDGDIRCYIENFNDLVDDLHYTVQHIIKKHPNIKLFLCGESMGGAVVLKYMIDKKARDIINGIILLSPLCGIDDDLKPGPFMTKLLLTLSLWFPTLKLASTTKNLSKKTIINEDFIKARSLCKYNYQGTHRLATIRELYKISLWIPENAYMIETPIIIFHGDNDIVTTPNGSINVYNNINIMDKELVIIENGDHSLLLPKDDGDMTSSFIMAKMLKWLDKHLA